MPDNARTQVQLRGRQGVREKLRCERLSKERGWRRTRTDRAPISRSRVESRTLLQSPVPDEVTCADEAAESLAACTSEIRVNSSFRFIQGINMPVPHSPAPCSTPDREEKRSHALFRRVARGEGASRGTEEARLGNLGAIRSSRIAGAKRRFFRSSAWCTSDAK